VVRANDITYLLQKRQRRNAGEEKAASRILLHKTGQEQPKKLDKIYFSELLDGTVMVDSKTYCYGIINTSY
jgi:hypothetical protein